MFDNISSLLKVYRSFRLAQCVCVCVCTHVCVLLYFKLVEVLRCCCYRERRNYVRRYIEISNFNIPVVVTESFSETVIFDGVST